MTQQGPLCSSGCHPLSGTKSYVTVELAGQSTAEQVASLVPVQQWRFDWVYRFHEWISHSHGHSVVGLVNI